MVEHQELIQEFQNFSRTAPTAKALMEHISQRLHEALDQTGALSGPLIASLVLALHHDYRAAFLWLGVPAFLTILSVVTVRARFPYAGHVSVAAPGASKDVEKEMRRFNRGTARSGPGGKGGLHRCDKRPNQRRNGQLR